MVVKAQPSQAASLPASATSKVLPLQGSSFDPQRIFAARSPGVVTIFAYFGDPKSEATERAQGSGFVISPKGYILTNSHVITNAGESSKVQAAQHLYVEFADGDRVEAHSVGWDLYDDVGLIRVDPGAHRLSPVPLGDSALVNVGEPVAAIGSPLGNENTLTVGVVSAIHRSIGAITVQKYKVIDAIQTDTPITHGSSGGPLLDARGRVIGINAQIRSTSGNGNDSGIGFAIPIDAAKNSVAQLIDKGRVTYAYVGISTENMTPSLARVLGYKTQHGALIVDVSGGSPGAKAGLEGGDREVDVLDRNGDDRRRRDRGDRRNADQGCGRRGALRVLFGQTEGRRRLHDHPSRAAQEGGRDACRAFASVGLGPAAAGHKRAAGLSWQAARRLG